jgi:hypothetical protein
MLYPIPLEMVQVHVTFLLHNVAICSSCMFQVLTRPSVGTLLFHMSVFCGWVMCHFFIGPSVIFFIGPHGVTKILRVSFFYSTTCLDVVRPFVSILLGHVSSPELPRFLFLIQPCGRICTIYFVCIGLRVVSWLLHVSFTGSSMC